MSTAVEKVSKDGLQNEFEQKLMQQFGISIKDARKLARKARAAYPSETDLAVLTEYAETP